MEVTSIYIWKDKVKPTERAAIIIIIMIPEVWLKVELIFLIGIKLLNKEIDLINGKNRNQAILTINERSPGVLIIRKIQSKQASVVTKEIKDY